MKKILLLSLTALFISSVFAQNDSIVVSKKKKPPVNLANRSNDHFMVQLGYAGWSGKPDTINTGGLSKSLNVYFMFDYPFKTNPHLSMAFGLDLASDRISFKKTYVGIKDLTPTFQFTDQSDTTHFKRTSLSTSWVEVPVEFRFSSNPENSGKSLKTAIGVKVGLLLNAHTLNKDLETSGGSTLNAYSMKEYSKHFFNNNRISFIGRIGLGHLTLFGSYQFTALFKDGKGPDVKPFSIGLNLSGL